jgi:hypothetical protein
MIFLHQTGKRTDPIAGVAIVVQRSRRHCEPVHCLHLNPTFRDGHHSGERTLADGRTRKTATRAEID